MQATAQQQKVVENISSGISTGIEAKPGSGKSTLLRMVAEEYARKNPGNRILIVAFNKMIVEQMRAKVSSNVDVFSFHQLGNAIVQANCKLGYAQPNDNNFRYQITKLVTDFMGKAPDSYELVDEIIDVYNFLRVTSSSIDNLGLNNISQNWGKQFDPKVAMFLNDVHKISLRNFQQGCEIPVKGGKKRTSALIDFAGMVALPSLLNFKAKSGMKIGPNGSEKYYPFEGYDLILCDESQDFAKVYWYIIQQYANENCVFGFVGDPMQSINMFAGASPNSFENLVKDFNLVVEPLTKVFRCPRNHVDYLNQIFGTDMSCDNGDSPMVEYSFGEITQILKPGDMVLFRKVNSKLSTALPLFSRLLEEEIPVTLAGYDLSSIAKKIFRWIEKYIGKVDFSRFSNQVQEYLIANSRPWNAEEIVRDCEFVEKFAKLCKPYSTDNFIEQLEDLMKFKENSITISTMHKAKGGEWLRVFIGDFDQLFSSDERDSEMQKKQNLNLAFVGLSRCLYNGTNSMMGFITQ